MFPLSLWYWDTNDGTSPPTDAPSFTNVPARQLKTWWRINPVVLDTTNPILRLAVDNQFFLDNSRVLKPTDFLGIPYGDRVYAFTVDSVVPYFGATGDLINLYVFGYFVVDFAVVI